MNKNTSFDKGVSSKLKDIEYIEYTEDEYIKIANVLAPPYNEWSVYTVGDFVIYKNNIYECIEDCTNETFIENKWKYLGTYESN